MALSPCECNWHDVAVAELDDVVAYYERSWFDYRFLWMNPKNRAIHFGYWGPGVTSHAESLVAMNALLADAAGVTPTSLVLDAGCGVGGSSFWLAEERGARSFGITPVRDQVERANRYIAERGGLEGRTVFAVADYRAAPTPSSTFDVVWAQESLCHAPDKQRFFDEAARVLRPGGRLVIAEYLRAARPLDDRNEALLTRWLSGWAIPDLLTADEMRDGLAAAGFVDVDIRDLTAEVRPSLRRLHRYAAFLRPVTALLRVVRVRDRVQTGNNIGARNQWRALQRGAWVYGVITATR